MVAARNGDIELSASRGQLYGGDTERLGHVLQWGAPDKGIQLFARDLAAPLSGCVDDGLPERGGTNMRRGGAINRKDMLRQMQRPQKLPTRSRRRSVTAD